MGTSIAREGIEPWRRRLLLPAYRIAESARYAKIPPQTVTYWHYAKGQYDPALPDRVKGEALSYMQLVELAFVAVMRSLGVKLKRIRSAREYLAQNLNEEYPFASHEFKTNGVSIYMQLGEFEEDAEEDKLIVLDENGQLAWRDILFKRFQEFDYEDNLAVRWHVIGRGNPVLIDPQVAFGAPTIRGVPTWTIKGRWQSGESLEDIASDFDLKENEINLALSFEGIEKDKRIIN